MEKQARKPLIKKPNSEIKMGAKAIKTLYMSKIRQAEKVLKSKAAQIVVPLIKIQKKISLKFDVFNKDYTDIIKKAEIAFKEINTHLEENKSDNMNLTDVQLNQKYANDHENMIKFYENVCDKLELFTRLINSNEYNNIIQEFDKIEDNNNNENNIEKNNENNNDNCINFKEELDKLENNYVILKKNNKKNKVTKLIGINSNKILKKLGPNNSAQKPNNNKKIDEKKSTTKKSKTSLDLLEQLQNEYQDNYYIQKISKTFLKRRLFKNVIYRHIFDYQEDGSIKEDKLRSSGESTIYKYGKFIINFKDDLINEENCEKILKYFEPELKQCFIKKDEENKQFIIAGKLINLLNEFLEKIIRKNLYTDFNVIKIKVEFYEFYEELVNEFNEKEKNVKIVNCDEKILKNLEHDWESLNIVRDFVKKSKSKLEFKGENVINGNENVNENNNENVNENIINGNEIKEEKNNENVNENIINNINNINGNDIKEEKMEINEQIVNSIIKMN